MPRPVHPLWNEVEITVARRRDKPNPDVACRHCRVEMANAQPSRAMMKHIVTCPGISEATRDKWRRFQKGEERQEAPTNLQKRRRSASAGDDESVASSEMSEAEASEALDNETFQSNIAAAFYAAKIPVDAIDNCAVRRALLQGRPDKLQLPTRAALGLLVEQRQREEGPERVSVEQSPQGQMQLLPMTPQLLQSLETPAMQQSQEHATPCSLTTDNESGSSLEGLELVPHMAETPTLQPETRLRLLKLKAKVAKYQAKAVEAEFVAETQAARIKLQDLGVPENEIEQDLPSL